MLRSELASFTHSYNLFLCKSWESDDNSVRLHCLDLLEIDVFELANFTHSCNFFLCKSWESDDNSVQLHCLDLPEIYLTDSLCHTSKSVLTLRPFANIVEFTSFESRMNIFILVDLEQ